MHQPFDTPALIRSEIAVRGPISFARFMELALYAPGSGYYDRPGTRPGRQGDFYTSVSVGSVFGELLGFQVASWLQELPPGPPGEGPPPSPHGDERGSNPSDAPPRTPPSENGGRPGSLMVVEAGAHDGQLAHDILSWLRAHRPAIFQRLEYVLLEPSPALKGRQGATLAAFGDRVRWVRRWDDVPPVRGVILSNELLDAFPVHRLGWDARRRDWIEWGVDHVGDRFAWVRLGPWEGSRELLPPTQGADGGDLGAVLPEGFTIEVSPAAAAWWSEAARALRQGWMVTLDYGLELEERLAPQRASGTLRAYRGHRLVEDPLADPGTQDLTAHVDFTALLRSGELAGLESEPLMLQAKFLTRIVEQAGRVPDGSLAWDEARIRQFATLTHPAHLGHAFRVLVQSRRIQSCWL